MEYCSNCMENIISEPIEAEIERNICPDGIEMDVPVIIYFCSEECKDEYFEPLTTKTKDILTLQLENSILLNALKELMRFKSLFVHVAPELQYPDNFIKAVNNAEETIFKIDKK